jgi:HD-like signal output (HDOD) protein
MNFEHIINNIDSLPPLSNAANIVQSLYAAGLDNINVKSLVKTIESDVMLKANILRVINSPYYGLRTHITSMQSAVTLFGAKRIQMLVINYAMQEQLKADPSIYGFTSLQFNDFCQLQSSLMFQWYSKINAKEAQYLAALVLIMEVGKLILAKEVIESDYAGEFRKGFNECEDIQEYEMELLGCTSYTLSALLFEHWNLDDNYANLLKNIDNDDLDDVHILNVLKKIKIIRTAINVKDILSDTAISKAAKRVRDLGYDAQEFVSVAQSIRDQYLQL